MCLNICWAYIWQVRVISSKMELCLATQLLACARTPCTTCYILFWAAICDGQPYKSSMLSFFTWFLWNTRSVECEQGEIQVWCFKWLGTKIKFKFARPQKPDALFFFALGLWLSTLFLCLCYIRVATTYNSTKVHFWIFSPSFHCKHWFVWTNFSINLEWIISPLLVSFGTQGKDHLSGLYSLLWVPHHWNEHENSSKTDMLSASSTSLTPAQLYYCLCQIAMGWRSVNYTCHSTPTIYMWRYKKKLQCIPKSFCSPVWKLYFCNEQYE